MKHLKRFVGLLVCGAFCLFPCAAVGDSSIVFHSHVNGEDKIAITFDDGPHPRYTPQILSILEEFGVRATFFVVGENVEYYPELVGRILAAGHEIGNHTYDHGRMPRQTVEQMKEDLRPQAEFAIRSRAAIDEIVQLEGLEADKEDIGKALAVICRHNNITMDQLKEQYDAALEQAVINSVLTGKVMRLIRDAAIVEE